MNVNYLTAPPYAGPHDTIVGQTETGLPIYQTSLGQTYSVQPQYRSPLSNGPPAGVPLAAPSYQAGPTTHQNTSGRQMPDYAGNMLSALWHGIQTPGRALAGQPVSQGDVLNTALDWGLMSAPMAAPEGALRAGGIRGYHGSPADFNAFDDRFIGTGEGNQAYGHGHYVAGAEPVAQSYRDALSSSDLMVNGQPYDPSNIAHVAAVKAADYPSIDAAIADMTRQNGLLSKIKSDSAQAHMAENKKIIAELRKRKPGSVTEASHGHMYEVNINADPSHFLDWDKPLSEQPQVAQKLGFGRQPQAIHDEAQALFDKYGPYPDMPAAIQSRVQELQSELDRAAPNTSGADYYRGTTPDDYLHSMMTGSGNPSAVSQELASKGVPGIKYLDQGSRYNPAVLPHNPIADDARKYLDAAGGDATKALDLFNQSNPADTWSAPERDEIRRVINAAGRKMTHNYVVFDPKLINIIRKYGFVPGMLGANALTQRSNQLSSQ